jgi:hypothetical protein
MMVATAVPPCWPFADASVELLCNAPGLVLSVMGGAGFRHVQRHLLAGRLPSEVVLATAEDARPLGRGEATGGRHARRCHGAAGQAATTTATASWS